MPARPAYLRDPVTGRPIDVDQAEALGQVGPDGGPAAGFAPTAQQGWAQRSRGDLRAFNTAGAAGIGPNPAWLAARGLAPATGGADPWVLVAGAVVVAGAVAVAVRARKGKPAPRPRRRRGRRGKGAK